ncbi:MAG: RHS repeat-associated core domain-containing protein, partial [Spirochaetota bacterium]
SQAVKETVLRSVFWSGWQVVEERERTAEIGRPLGEEKVARQFVDGGGIDEHLSVDMYNQDGTSIEKTYWFHQNARGDTVALTDENGSVVKRYSYSSYGEPFEVDDNGNLTPVEDLSLSGYYFQGRSIDEETGLYFFRNRYFDPVQGRFINRDPLGYADSMGLYEFVGSRPGDSGDPLGLGRCPWCGKETHGISGCLHEIFCTFAQHETIQQIISDIENAPSKLATASEMTGRGLYESVTCPVQTSKLYADNLVKQVGGDRVAQVAENYLRANACYLEEEGDILLNGGLFVFEYGFGSLLGSSDLVEAYLGFDPATLRDLEEEEVAQRYLLGTGKALITAGLTGYARDVRRYPSYYYYERGANNILGLGQSDPLLTSSEVVWREKGIYTVVAHSNKQQGLFVTSSGDTVSAREAVNYLYATGYQGGTIRLITCFAGKTGLGQSVANAAGTTVLAPTHRVWILPSGELKLYLGYWAKFTPK